jgi:hypothetical protein
MNVLINTNYPKFQYKSPWIGKEDLVSRRVIFKKLHTTSDDIVQLFFLVCAFYAFEYLMFYNHHNHDDNVTIIPSTMGTRQNDSLGETLFALVHFKGLCFTASHFLSCLFPSITDNIHIISPFYFMSTYEHFKTEFHVIGLSIEP